MEYCKYDCYEIHGARIWILDDFDLTKKGLETDQWTMIHS